jgi:hypothetical protein
MPTETAARRPPARRRAPEDSDKEMDTQAQENRGPRSGTLNLPFVTAHWRLPELHMPAIGRQEVAGAVKTARSYLPPPAHLVYYSGLGLLAVFEVVAWPVAMAVAAGMIVTHRVIQQNEEHEKSKQEHPTPPEKSTE